ncbi:MAG: divalent metal ion transporter [bacterium P3]|nr:MAG: divalent metal ion transporter [bacterium P3]KWW41990.1 MAG: divalent metal ion transporter [bacterium F083]
MIESIRYQHLKWQHITNPSEDDYDYLLEQYHFHPLDIEDCRGTNQRPKIDEYDDYYFLILHFPYFDKGNKFIRVREVKIFWGRDYIITIGRSHWVVKKLFDEIQEDLAEGNEEVALKLTSSDILLYHILDRLMRETYTLVMRVGAEVELINYDIFNKKAQSIIELISVTRRNTILLNTTFKPQLRVLHMFESGGIKGFVNPDDMDMEDYWGNILDQYQKMFDSIEDYGELVEGLSKTFDSLQANKTNEIMKVLTYFNTVMLPLTVVTGIFGMNVDFPFVTNVRAFWTIVFAMILITAGLIVFFRRQTRR